MSFVVEKNVYIVIIYAWEINWKLIKYLVSTKS